MEKNYKQLRLEDRDKITEMMAEGRNITEIAEVLGRHKSTISREVLRNSSPEYRLYLSHRAHDRAVKRKQEANSHPRLKTEEIVCYVHCKLKMGWSPEQIAGRLSMDYANLRISHEAIYQPTPQGYSGSPPAADEGLNGFLWIEQCGSFNYYPHYYPLLEVLPSFP